MRAAMARFSSVPLLALALFVAACGTGTTTESADMAPPAPDMAVACGDPDALTMGDCGTLAWAPSDVKSRKRNHHFTVAARTPAGAFLYVAGGVDLRTLL